MQPGEMLGDRYLLEALIGEGAFARTYRARDTRLERVVAIKVLRPHIAADPAFLNRFRQEARAVARIDHPNVVHVYDSGEDGGASYLVMQYVPGLDLKQYIIESAPLPVTDAIRITREILNGLAAVHRAGIIHRDIKPQNVLYGWDEIARVTDFGIAYEGNQNRQPFATEHGTTLGTPAYMAPEQARGEQLTAATDIYAVGILLFELLTGRLPFTAENQLAMMVAHVEQAPPAPSSFQRGVPPDLDVITLRAMAKTPGQRFATASDMEQSLANALRTLSNRSTIQSAPSVAARGNVQHTAPAATAGLPVSREFATAQPKRSHPARWIIPFLFLALAAGIVTAALTGAFDNLGGAGDDPKTPRPTRTAQGYGSGLQPVTKTPNQSTTEPENDPTEEGDPTETPVSTIDEQDGGVPTIAPSDGNNGGDVTSEPDDGELPPSLAFSATDWEGGVTRNDSGFLGRAWTAIYGESSGSNEASINVSLERAPDGDATLILTGLGDESGVDSPIAILVNGVEIFAEASPFEHWDGEDEDAPWTDFSITIPAGLLQAGTNQVTVANLNPEGEVGTPPYVLLADVIIDFG